MHIHFMEGKIIAPESLRETIAAFFFNRFIVEKLFKGITAVGPQTGKPTFFGIAATENIKQAIERTGSKAGSKGYDCALAVIENFMGQVQ